MRVMKFLMLLFVSGLAAFGGEMRGSPSRRPGFSPAETRGQAQA